MLDATSNDVTAVLNTTTFVYSTPFLVSASEEGAWDLMAISSQALTSLVLEVCDENGNHGVPLRLDADFDTTGGVLAAAKGVQSNGTAIGSSFHQAPAASNLAFRLTYSGIYRWGFKSNGGIVTIRHNAR